MITEETVWKMCNEEGKIKLLNIHTKYPKIYTLFERGENFKIHDVLNEKYLNGITNIKEFVVTEKIDGSNCGIVLDYDKNIWIRKRSTIVKDTNDNHIYFEATKDAPFDKIKEYFADTEHIVTIFGEACGAGIQKGGGKYSQNKTFLVFDIKVGNNFFNWREVDEFCDKVGMKTVPWLCHTSILESDFHPNEIRFLVLDKPLTQVKEGVDGFSEGVVVRSEPALLNKFGQRMMFKVKFKDYLEEEVNDNNN